MAWSHAHCHIYKIKQTVHIYTHSREGVVCAIKGTNDLWPCIYVPWVHISQTLPHIVLAHVSSHCDKTHLERNYLSRCREDAWSSEAVKSPPDCCLNAIPSPRQPEAKLKVFSAAPIKWAETSSDSEQNSTICRTICNPRSSRAIVHVLHIHSVSLRQ